MILDSSLRLEAVLAGAITTSQPEVHVDYRDYNQQGEITRPAPSRIALNSTTDVIILAAPNAPFIREPSFVSIYNKDTVTVTVTVKSDDSTNERIVAKATLLTLEVLMYEKGNGWYVLTAAGGFKQGGVSVVGSSTDNAVVRWDGATGTAIQNSLAIVDDSGNVTGVLALTAAGLTVNGQAIIGAGTSNPLKLVGLDAVGDCYLTFFESGGSTRKAYLGFGNSGDDTFFLTNEETASIVLSTGGSTVVTLSSGATALTGTLDATGAATALSGTSIPAGGTAGSGYKFSSTTNFGVFFGSGAPTLSAAKGSLYLRSDGSGTNDRAYINTNGTTTWTAVVTVA